MTTQRIEDACKEYKESVLTNKKEVLRTGLEEFDERIQIVKGDYVLLSGREGVGKTSLALQMVYNFAKEGKSVAIFCTRTKKEEVLNRLLSLASGEKININNVFPGEASFLEALDKISVMDIYIVEELNKIGEIVEEIKRRSDRCDVLFFDHFNYILPDEYDEEEFAEALPEILVLQKCKMLISGEASIEKIKEVAGDSTVLITIPNSTNNRFLADFSKPPIDDHMVYGFDFQESFDKVMLLHRDDYYGRGIPGHAELHVIERWRCDRIVDLAYDNKTLSFSEMTDDKMRELRTEHEKEYQVDHFFVCDNVKDEEEEEEETPIVHWDFFGEDYEDD